MAPRIAHGRVTSRNTREQQIASALPPKGDLSESCQIHRERPHPDSYRKLLIGGLAQSAELVHYSVAFPRIRAARKHRETSSNDNGEALPWLRRPSPLVRCRRSSISRPYAAP